MATKSVFKDVIIKDENLAKDLIKALSSPDSAKYKSADTAVTYSELRGDEVKAFFGRNNIDD